MLSPKDRHWLVTLADHYGATPGDMDDLLLRVDVIPVSLALAQAIVESGWGTSRFAREGNALYGQRVWTVAATSMIPKRAKRVRVRSFADLMTSVRSYMHNLNSHFAYGEFRARRAAIRARGMVPKGLDLTDTLTRYAESDDYVRSLRGLIRSNALEELERARLETGFYARRRASASSRIAGDS